jgi:hypothetical protein
MRVMRTTEDPAYPLGKLVSPQKTLGLDHFALAMNPFGLDGIQPRALLGQSSLPPSSQASRGCCPRQILSESGGAVPYVQRIGDFMATNVTDNSKPILKTG